MKENKIKANIYLKSEIKPLGKVTSKISSNILKYKEELEIEDFAYKLSKEGMTTVLATYSNLYRNKTPLKAFEIEGQQLVALDFDNKDLIKYNLEDLEKDEFLKANAIFWYHTFSDLESELDKFRVFIKLDRVVENKEVIEAIYSKLLNMYPAADTTVSYSARMVYGSNRGFTEINFNNDLNVDSFLDGYTIPKKDKKRTLTSAKSKSSAINVNVEFNSSILTEDSPLWQLLKAKSFTLAKKNLEMKFQIEKSIFPNYSSLMNYLDQQNMVELFDLPTDKTFHDIFHEEVTASSSVFQHNVSKRDIYKCHSESHKFKGGNTIVLAKLLNTGQMKALKQFEELIEVYVDVDSKLKDIISETQLMLTTLNSIELPITMPNTYKIFGKDLDIINEFFLILNTNFIEDFATETVYLANYYGLNGLATTISHKLGQNISVNRLHKIIITMSIVGLVTKLTDVDVPDHVLQTLNQTKLMEGYQYRTDVYMNKGFEDDFLDYLEDITFKLNDNGYRKGNVSYDFFVRSLGSNFERLIIAYPQKKTSEIGKTSEITDIYLNQAVKFVTKWVTKRGYITELQLKVYLAKTNGVPLGDADYRLGQLKVDLINSYGFERIQMNKQMKNDFDTAKDKYIKPNGYPVIYTK